MVNFIIWPKYHMLYHFNVSKLKQIIIFSSKSKKWHFFVFSFLGSYAVVQHFLPYKGIYLENSCLLLESLINSPPLATKIIRISFLVHVLWPKEFVSPLIFQRISELDSRVNLVVRASADQLWQSMLRMEQAWMSKFCWYIYEKYL